MPLLIDGAKCAESIQNEIKQKVAELKEKDGIVPGLAVVIVGSNPASMVYVNMKKKACQKCGMNSFEFALKENSSKQEILKLIHELNNRKDIHGILVQLPLPKHIDTEEILFAIDPKKDVDGFNPDNVGRLTIGKPNFVPCTPYGIYKLFEFYNIHAEGKHVVILGRSNIVGKPMGMLMLQNTIFANATLTFCHSKTKDIEKYTKEADIIIAAIGKPLFLTADMVKKGVVVIDVGINRVQDATLEKGYKIVGDVDFEKVKEKASAITPVPGGVGPMTITMLLYNTLMAVKK